MGLYERIGDKTTQAITAFNLGHAYKNVPNLRDLDAAERSYRRALDLYGDGDRRNQAGALAQLGTIAYERFTETGMSNGGEQELLLHLDAAEQFYVRTLDLLPEEAMHAAAGVHAQIGNVYSSGGRLNLALVHWQVAIRNFESCDDIYRAARTKFNVAQALRLRGRNT